MYDVRLSNIILPAYYELHRAVKAGAYSEYWLKGGRSSGKSTWVGIEIPLGLVKEPDANAIVFRKIGNTLRDSVYDQILKGIDMLGMSAHFQAKKNPLEIIYKPTGQRIMFRGADDPIKTKSITLRKGYFKFLWFEELAEFGGIDEIRTIKASINRGKKPTTTIYTYNPPITAQNWTNQEALIDVPGRYVHHSTYLDIPKGLVNEAFLEDAEMLKQTNERAYRHMYLGEVTGTGGQVFDNLTIRAITDEEYNRFDKLYNGLDFGFAVDPDAFVSWYYDRAGRKLYCVSEYFGARTPTDTLAEKIKNAIGGGIVTCDSEEPRMINELRRRGITAIPAKKGPGSVEHGMRWLQELAEIVIDPRRTPNTAREFSSYEYESDKNGNFLPAYPDCDNHTIDATRYSLETVSAERIAKLMKKSALGV